MKNKEVHAYLAGKIFLNARFREELLADPEYASQQLGVYLSDEQIENLQSLDQGAIEDWLGELESQVGFSPSTFSVW
jgi:hypothetical protein